MEQAGNNTAAGAVAAATNAYVNQGLAGQPAEQGGAAVLGAIVGSALTSGSSPPTSYTPEPQRKQQSGPPSAQDPRFERRECGRQVYCNGSADINKKYPMCVRNRGKLMDIPGCATDK